jgi:hypothetical protein
MKKEKLIELYPDLVKKIAIEYCHKVILLADKEEDKLWEEYLSENKLEPEFIVQYIRFQEKQLWVSSNLKTFGNAEKADIIDYDLALELGEIISVTYNKIWYSIEDTVSYNLKKYKILSFDEEIVNIILKDDSKSISVHISNLSKL